MNILVYYKKIVAMLVLVVIFSPNLGVIAQEGSNHKTTRTTTTDQNHPGPGTNGPPGLTFNKGLDKAREIVTQKTQFQLLANTSSPRYIWGDKDYSIQNQISLSSITEYSDMNGNLVLDNNSEFVQALIFDNNVNWNFSQEMVNSTELIFTLYTTSINSSVFNTTQINMTQYILGGDNFVKFNIEIVNWPWLNQQDRLAINFNFALIGLKSFSDAHISYGDNNSQFNGANNGIYISNNNNKTIGYLLNNNFAYGGSNKNNLTVTNQFILNQINKSAKVVLNFPYFGKYLLQDPIIGSNGDTVVFSQLYSILIEKSGLLVITTFLSILSLMVLFYVRKRK